MRLSHPNIIKIYQVIDTETECFIVMEYAKGGEMIALLPDEKALSEPEARRYFRQLVSAMDHAHSSNIVHRDLKLENLLLDQNKDLLVSDFGFGRTFDPANAENMSVYI
jgi:serine/threonine protein kinase